MPRPHKCRNIHFPPEVYRFKPAGIPGKFLEEVVLTLDELEAIRLGDLEGLYQETAAKRMNISRQTFGNIITSAHSKVADSLINGKNLKIDGGTISMLQERNFGCADCRHEWAVPFGTGRPHECPKCGGSNIHRSAGDKEYFSRSGRKRGCARGSKIIKNSNTDTTTEGENINADLHTDRK